MLLQGRQPNLATVFESVQEQPMASASIAQVGLKLASIKYFPGNEYAFSRHHVMIPLCNQASYLTAGMLTVKAQERIGSSAWTSGRAGGRQESECAA